MGSTARAGWCWRRGRGWRNSLCEMDIQAIIDAIRHNRVRITDHADEEAQADLLSFDEIFYSVLHGEVIEDYPSDTHYPSCLIYGDSFVGDRVHSPIGATRFLDAPLLGRRRRR